MPGTLLKWSGAHRTPILVPENDVRMPSAHRFVPHPFRTALGASVTMSGKVA